MHKPLLYGGYGRRAVSDSESERLCVRACKSRNSTRPQVSVDDLVISGLELPYGPLRSASEVSISLLAPQISQIYEYLLIFLYELRLLAPAYDVCLNVL